MKKMKTVMISFLCTALLMTGCVESDIGVKLNADETGTISTTIGISEDFYYNLIGMGSEVFENKETITYEHNGKIYIACTEINEYKSFDEIEQALLAMTYETDMFNEIGSNTTVEVDADLEETLFETAETEENDTPEENSVVPPDKHIFRSVEIEKNSGLFNTVYTFNAELNSHTTETVDESMTNMDIPIDDVFHMTFSIEMPYEITESSGGTVEGNKVTFEIDDIAETETFSVHCEQSNITAVVIIVTALVLLFITLIVCVNRRKNNE